VDAVLTTQWGSGLWGGETAIAHLYARTMFDALLFLDITTAFASLVRHIVLDVQAGDEACLLRLKSVGFCQDETQSI
jgi:hypothetical protein